MLSNFFLFDQRLEFLGDAVLDYLITSYLYSGYPDLKPGQLTDLKSMTVNNISFAHTAVSLSLHKYLIQDSDGLMEAIENFQASVYSPVSEEDIVNVPGCPKVCLQLIKTLFFMHILFNDSDYYCVTHERFCICPRMLCIVNAHGRHMSRYQRP